MPEQINPRFYGRRKGRPLSQNMQRLLESLLPSCGLGHADFSAQGLAAQFGPGITDICLEIGFGGGEHLAALAARCPETGFIGAEPFINGVVSLLRHIENEGLENIRIWPDDVRLILDIIPAGSLSCVYVMFPDPWPKARHARRRILNQDMLDKIARLLLAGGYLRMASDHPAAKSWMLAEAVRHPAFLWTASRASHWRERPSGWPQTRYLKKADRQGRTPSWFEFKRR